MRSSAWLQVSAICVFVVLGFVIYSNTLQAPFYFDDTTQITENPDIRLTGLGIKEIAGLIRGMKGFSGRPVANLSFGLNYYFNQYQVTGYHLFNIAVHILAGIFLYLFLKATLGLPEARAAGMSPESARASTGGAGDPSAIAFLAALLWLVNPVETQSVTYIVQRMNSMAAMFYILSFWLYVRGRLARGLGRALLWFSGCAAAAMLAMGSKEIALTLPFFILLYEWYFFQGLSLRAFKRVMPCLAAVLVLLCLFAFHYFHGNPMAAILAGYKDWDFSLQERLWTELRVVVHYMSLLVYPHPARLNLDYDFPVSHGLFDPVTTLFSALGIAGLLVAAIILAKRRRLISFCILWFFGNLVMESSIIALDLIFEHRAYLPSMLFFVPWVIMGRRYATSARVFTGLACCVILLFCLGTYNRNAVWADPVALAADCARKSPDKARNLNRLGVRLAAMGEIDDAIASYARALEVDPDFAPAHNNLALALTQAGRYDEAMDHFMEALRIRPGYAKAHYGLGMAFFKKTDLKKAIKHLSEALRINPNFVEAHNSLGLVLARQGKIEASKAHFSMALGLKPDFAEAHYNLAVVLSRQGRPDEAVSHYKKAIALNPQYAEAHNNLGILLGREGRLSEAMSHFSRALAIRPGYASAHANLKKARRLMRAHP